MPIWLQVLSGVFGLIGIAVGGWFTVQAAVNAKRTAAYPELDKRVGNLERQVGTLLEEKHEDRRFIRDMLHFIEMRFAVSHHELPFPLPRWLIEERDDKKDKR